MLESILWLTLTVYHEARGEPDIGQRAVAHVIMNRAERRGLTVKEVVLQPKQFSCFNNEIKFPNHWGAVYKALKNITTAVQEEDFTRGSTFYHNKSVNPKWASRFELVEEIGNHKFYRR